MRSAVLIIALLALHLGGCVHRRAAMPIGIFDAHADSFPELAANGFNLVVAPASQTNLDAARKSGISVLITGGGALARESGTQRPLRALDRHPAAWGWYLWDEPDLHQVAPGRVRAEEQRLKKLVSKPTVVVFSSGASVEKYSDAGDLFAVDWYPVPWSSVGTVAREMRLARLGADGKSFLAIIQAFDWNFATNLLHTDVPLRAPTPEELRCMTYLALMQGAGGILFYSYNFGEWHLEKHPALHRAVMELASELRANESMFGERVAWWRAETEFHGPPETMFNEIGESRISLALFRASKAENAFYLFAANTGGEPVDFSFKFPFRNVQELRTSCSEQDFQAEHGWIRKTYAPFEVCIFGPIRGELADE